MVTVPQEFSGLRAARKRNGEEESEREQVYQMTSHQRDVGTGVGPNVKVSPQAFDSLKHTRGRDLEMTLPHILVHV